MSTQNERSIKAQVIWNSTNSNSVTPTMVGSLFYDINIEKLERDNSNAVYQTYDASYTKVAAINPTTKKWALTEIYNQSKINDLLSEKQNVLEYTPENSANKSDSYTSSSSTTYASTKALVDGLATKLDKGTYIGTAQDLKNDIDTKQKKLSSFDESILIEPDGNIEGNVSLFTEYFQQQVCELNFIPIQIIGVYQDGIKLSNSEYEIILPKKIKIKEYVNENIQIEYTHLKS